jgi:deoxyribodipyrimidine photo-lyase
VDVVKVDPRRVRRLNRKSERPGPVLYWMSRDQRAEDNWALLYAQELASRCDSTVAVVFCLVPQFMGATVRHYEFMLAGLEQVEKVLSGKNVPFQLLTGDPVDLLPGLLDGMGCGALVTDFDPLKIKRRWKSGISKVLEIPFYEVDAHNIVPCWEASGRQEYAAYTIRPKISRMLGEFLTAFPGTDGQRSVSFRGFRKADWQKSRKALELDSSVKAVSWVKPGSPSASEALRGFIENGLSRYPAESNDPNAPGQSGLSPYLHFGQISAQRVALEVGRADAAQSAREAFLEQLIVRRELSDNFCCYNKYYDSTRGFPDWARRTLDEHRSDPRSYLYGIEQFEMAETHDDLWNAAQTEMSRTGRMHGYMRMYWAKKVLEWTRSPEAAMEILISLNDRYELDGRDPNGYVGVAWSVGGVHDRAWKERGVFGKIRYMSYEGCRRKFDVDGYIERIDRIDT